jgi:hypothetical protein
MKLRVSFKKTEFFDRMNIYQERVAGGCRRLHNERLRNLYTSPNVIKVIKSRRMRGWGMWHTWDT